jgi:SpoVK/Ycf46/Vps4 family AAA+-type ATPase
MKPRTRISPAKPGSLLPSLPDFIEERSPLSEKVLIYPPDVGDAICGLRTQIEKVDSAPRAFLFGNPGFGKSATLLNLAHASPRPFWWIRGDQMFSSFLGGTSSNLSTVFTAAEQCHAVLVFDDFDSIARKRTDPRESGESRRVVTALLAALDESRQKIAVLAATNLPEVVDSAVVRRFNLLIPFKGLATPEVEALLHSVLNIDTLTEDLLTMAQALSPAEVVEIVHALGPRPGIDELRATLARRTEAMRLIRGL